MTTQVDSSRDNPSLSSKQIQQYDEERQYLEGLLNKRLNFYMVFASLLIVGLFGSGAITSLQRAVGLFFGAAVSIVLSIAVWRTHLLIEHILERLRKTTCHPYAFAWKELNRTRCKIFRWNANATFALIPAILAVLFLILAALAFFADEQHVASQPGHVKEAGIEQ